MPRFAHVTVADDPLLLLLLLARGRVVLWAGQVVELRRVGLEEHYRLRLVDFELAAGAVVLRAVDHGGGLGCRSGPTAPCCCSVY